MARGLAQLHKQLLCKHTVMSSIAGTKQNQNKQDRPEWYLYGLLCFYHSFLENIPKPFYLLINCLLACLYFWQCYIAFEVLQIVKWFFTKLRFFTNHKRFFFKRWIFCGTHSDTLLSRLQRINGLTEKYGNMVMSLSVLDWLTGWVKTFFSPQPVQQNV